MSPETASHVDQKSVRNWIPGGNQELGSTGLLVVGLFLFPFPPLVDRTVVGKPRGLLFGSTGLFGPFGKLGGLLLFPFPPLLDRTVGCKLRGLVSGSTGLFVGLGAWWGSVRWVHASRSILALDHLYRQLRPAGHGFPEGFFFRESPSRKVFSSGKTLLGSYGRQV